MAEEQLTFSGCPCCKSDEHLEHGSISIDNGQAVQEVTCMADDCNTSFSEVYEPLKILIHQSDHPSLKPKAGKLPAGPGM